MDREKVIKGLKCLITNDVPCDGCQYNESYCIVKIASDALDLLKEQQETIEKLGNSLNSQIKQMGWEDIAEDE